MPEPTHLDGIRRSALDIADRSRRMWKNFILVFAFLEGACWVAYYPGEKDAHTS